MSDSLRASQTSRMLPRHSWAQRRPRTSTTTAASLGLTPPLASLSFAAASPPVAAPVPVPAVVAASAAPGAQSAGYGTGWLTSPVPGMGPAGYFSRTALAGAMCCCVTHSAMVPLDVVKTEMQLYPGRHKSLLSGARSIAGRGPTALLTGVGPTAVGYFAQGACKFGFYELFSHIIKTKVIGDEEAAQKYRVPVYIAAAASAEFIADLALCPMESTRIRLVSQPSFAKGLPDAFMKILRTEGAGAFYTGLTPILFKQIPYTITKFLVYEMVASAVYARLPGAADMAPSSKAAISLGSGLTAGVAAAIVSHPADTVLSVVNKSAVQGESAGAAIRRVFGDLRASGKLWEGLRPRCVMIGLLTAGQFLIFDGMKLAWGLPVQKK